MCLLSLLLMILVHLYKHLGYCGPNPSILINQLIIFCHVYIKWFYVLKLALFQHKYFVCASINVNQSSAYFPLLTFWYTCTSTCVIVDKMSNWQIYSLWLNSSLYLVMFTSNGFIYWRLNSLNTRNCLLARWMAINLKHVFF